MSLRSVIDRLRGRTTPNPLLERADILTDALEKGDIRVIVVAKNARALAELRRLDSHARR